MDANDQRRIFKRRIAQACQSLGVKFSDFKRARSFDDFVIDHLSQPRAAADIAVKALLELCEHDNVRLDFVTCVAVVSFLDDTLGAPREDMDPIQRTKDLAAILRTGGSEKAYRDWVNSWYR